MSTVPSIPIAPGSRFGRLTVSSRNPMNSPASQPRWDCQCKCGKTTTVLAGHLRSGKIASCGCLRCEPYHRTHGLTATPEHISWVAMRGRCLNLNNRAYARYGGRGITVCREWESFERFLADMGPRPSPAHSLDRIDNNGPYSPENCRWATRTEQSRNRRSVPRYEHEGISLTLPEWAERTGIAPSTLEYRVKKKRWPISRALTQPLHHAGR